MTTRILTRSLIVPLAALLMTTSCKDESCIDTGTCPEQSVLERIDLEITGEFNYEEILSSVESDKSFDLVSYTVYEEPHEVITIKLLLDNGHFMKIHVHNTLDHDPWEHVNFKYSIFPTQDLEDKTEFVIAEYYAGTEVPTYLTNLGTNYPPGAILEAFEVTFFDGVEFHCRLQNILLYKNIDPDQTITINGTFIGAVTFL